MVNKKGLIALMLLIKSVTDSIAWLSLRNCITPLSTCLFKLLFFYTT